jgi:type IV pilus assembly protein PilY1
LLVLASLVVTANAAAQSDVNPPLPDVLLLVDTSGSMEYKVGSTSFPTCYPDGSQPSEKSRWVDLVEVLTGSIKDYSCERIDREATSFRDGEYGTGGPLATAPYDYLYSTPYHRPLSNKCARGPGTLTSNVWEFPSTAFKEHPYNSLASSCTTSFSQSSDGILDTFERAIRFGLMTFDPISVDGVVGKGYTGTSTPNYADGVKGTWSYVWGSPHVGRPAGCLVDQAFEVGARNAAAPPWEGRMIPFGNPQSDEYLVKKEQIKKVLLGTRPYGPTPIAGLMQDARDFMISDTSKDPLDASQDFGPYNDPYVVDTNTSSGCRKRYIILLSDGQPNMDLRPDCGDSSSTLCPFKKPEEIALKLKTPDLPSQRPIPTYVIGFALAKFMVGSTEVTCNDLPSTDFDQTNPSALCNSTTPANLANTALQACCALNRIAVAGGTGDKPRALFASNRDELSSALSQILTSTTRVTSRTQPVIAGAAAGSEGFRFYSSVRPVSFQPWVGILQRQRYECDDDNQPKAQAVDKSKQDDFAANVNAGRNSRYFSTIRAGSNAEPVRSERTIRPNYTVSSGSGDGAGLYGGTRYLGGPSDFVSNTSPEMIQVDASICKNPDLSATACRDRYLKWLVGIPNDTPFSRCNPTTGECYLLGDILHSTPRVVGPPSAFVVDESYQVFARTAANQQRPLVLYTSTNDGFLHAFRVAPSYDKDPDKVLGPEPQNNELWAFVPPAILPYLRTQYPFAHKALLDGAPQVQDVVATSAVDPDNLAGMRFERTHADAQSGAGTWRTVLLQSFGTQSPAGGGYFALDVTTPTLNTGNLSDPNRGPRFLWQLTTDAGGKPLFGKGSTPVIATLFFDPSGGNNPKEIAVAILPGGAGQPGTLGPSPGYEGCPKAPDPVNTFAKFEQFTPRQQVRCYDAADPTTVASRSLTVVRLDTGEIVRTFRRAKTDVVDTDLQKLVITAPLDSPISGQPVAFPSDTASIADRAYVGDQDGRLWKADFSSTNPSNWTMSLFFDAFPASSDLDTTFTHTAGSGQPLALPPVVSVDANGDITINIATGDQDTSVASTANKNFVWSLTEKTSGGRTAVATHVNWFTALTGGERVVGPMSLFNSQLVFSSYAPPEASLLATHACNSGTSRVWGMDYIRASDKDNLALGGLPRLPDPDDAGEFVQRQSAAQVAGDASAVIFGVSVAQEPSCTTEADTTSDSFLGYKTERTVTHVSPGKFQLVMHIGGVDNPVRSDDLQANVRTIDLQPPPSAARVDSWAALLE